MKNFAHIPILALVASAALSGEAIHEEADMKANARLNVSNVAGSVEIEGWSRKKIEVTGELGDESELVFDVDGDTVTVKVETDHKKKKRWRGSEGSDLVIRVPHSTRVSATTVSADLTVREIKGTQRLQTVSGDLKTQIFDKEAECRTVSGEIEIAGHGSRSQLKVASVSGEIDVADVSGEITAKTVSGDVDLQSAEVSRLRLDSVSGDLDFSGKLETGGRIDAESVSGDVTLNLFSLYNTDYVLESFSGDIDSILGYDAEKTSRYSPGSRLELTEGAGDSRVRVETMSGDIEITATTEPKKKPRVQQTSSLSWGANVQL